MNEYSWMSQIIKIKNRKKTKWEKEMLNLTASENQNSEQDKQR